MLRSLVGSEMCIRDRSRKFTPLSIACTKGYFEIVVLLLQHGAEVNQPDYVSRTPFHCCFIRLQEKSNTFENRLICFKMADLLLEYGADINWIVDKEQGYTYLMKLCSLKNFEGENEKEICLDIICYLLQRGANRDIVTHNDQTAYDLSLIHI
eukprot:TRINITY_DN6765_c0_g1_i2.p1 TRINITY_DN6765_c0_g1~~TRINITY_DN6765_c0_g1_i2.p1  ORF type:complete len:153 (+),score=22.90 TRINITY_DN6765_c0_g1_i2:41-499(+)